MTEQIDERDEPVHVQVDPQFAGDVVADDLRQAAVTTMRLSSAVWDGAVDGRTECSIVIVDDELMRQLNRDYRGIDFPTDVLSFGGETDEFVSAAEGEDIYLGDVVISHPRAKAQAVAAGHAVGAELSLLVVHGMLHLLGYDHTAAEQKARMWRQQALILQALGLHSVLPTEND